MVLESLKAEWLEHHPLLAFGIGLVYTILGSAIAWFFFRSTRSVPVLFLATLLIVPSLIKVLRDEEKVERKEGLKHFFHNHRKVIEIYFFLFLGVFVGYLLIGFFEGDMRSGVFAYQFDVLEQQQGLDAEGIQKFLDSQFQPEVAHFLGVLQHDLIVLLLLFGLSFFYGAGAIFLIVLNASIFAAFVLYVVRAIAAQAADFFTVLGVFSIHMLPEMVGFLIAAIAGGVVSAAVVKEKFRSKGFRNVMRDAAVLLFIACAFIVVGALLEVYVTTQVFTSVF